MIRLKPRQRGALGDTLRELANFAVAALVFGQFVGERSIVWWLILAGMALWLVLVWYALILEGE